MDWISRRSFIQSGMASMVGASAINAQPVSPPDIKGKAGLAAIAARAKIVFGASAAQEIFTDENYRKLYLKETKSITTDYALKFDSLRPDEKTFRFEGADALIQFAKDNGLVKRGHTLIWNENAPAWLNAKSNAEKIKIMDEHIDTVISRYAGKIEIWDAVNEPFWPGHGAEGGFRQGPWYSALGKNYVQHTLKRAAKIDSKTKLAINEAHTERSDELGLAIRAGLLRLIDDLQHAGVPLHAIGLQGHLQPQFPSNDEGYVEFLRQIAARKLDIHITELDLDDSSYKGNLAEREGLGAKRVYDFMSKVLSVPRVTMLSTWQLVDRYSWYRDPDIMRRSSATHLPRPLPFDDSMNRKPMWLSIAKAFSERAAT